MRCLTFLLIRKTDKLEGLHYSKTNILGLRCQIGMKPKAVERSDLRLLAKLHTILIGTYLTLFLRCKLSKAKNAQVFGLLDFTSLINEL